MAEPQIVESECLPFSNIPGTSRLFEDFVHHFDRVSAFYARPPHPEEWWKQELHKIQYPAERRAKVAAILERQNRQFGAGQETLKNIERLRNGAAAVVTGQQVGLFGGPLFCVLKALTAAQLAAKTGAVPVFWLASEDHDIEEIDYVNLPAVDHLKKIAVNVPHREGAPVGCIEFGDEITAAVQQVRELLGDSEMMSMLAACYKKGETFATAFAKFYARALQQLGIIFLNPLDAELHRIAQPVFHAALNQADEINHALLDRGKELESAGYHAQVKVTPSHTLCFYFENGVRTPVRQDGDAGTFRVGEKKLTRDELLGETERCPERFSANVLLRPLMQDYLLPTLLYIGGPAEIAYFAQIETVYRHIAARVTPVVPRFFATLVETRSAKLLDRYGFKVSDLFVGPEKLREVVAAHALPDSLMNSFDEAATKMEEALTAIRQPLEKLDRTLLDAAENAGSKMKYQLQSLRDKAARAEARKNSELQKHADELSTLLYPNKELQEREIGAAYFLLKYGMGLIAKLQAALNANCVEHQIIRV
jgi:bacillithiol synthase